jgi:exopolysaccharide biosynthesis polyprenyl glycosylphosphotransferase
MIMPDYHLARYRKEPAQTRMSIQNYHGIPMLMLAANAHSKPALLLKRSLDLLLSCMILIMLSPLFLGIAILVKITSRGPVFYRWKVTGKNGRAFTSYKFRTMVEDADRLKEKFLEVNEMQGPVFKMKNDPRVTGFGRILRKYSLDEIPQFYSVLKGDMSLVGPRPPLGTETERFEFWQRRKLSVKPGITCLWQVNGRNEISDFRKWVELDLQYIDNWSLGLDISILLRTIPAVLRGTGR